MIVPIRVVEAEPFRRFSFRWNHPQGAAPDESNSALVEFSLVEEADGTRLRVLESGIDAVTHDEESRARYREDHEQGWETASRRNARLRGLELARSDALMAAAVAEDDALWAAVADPTRRRVLDALLEQGEATTTTLAEGLPVTRQAVAKHLVVLNRVGLVAGRPSGPGGALRGPARAARRRRRSDGSRGRAVGQAPGADQAARRVRAGRSRNRFLTPTRRRR